MLNSSRRCILQMAIKICSSVTGSFRKLFTLMSSRISRPHSIINNGEKKHCSWRVHLYNYVEHRFYSRSRNYFVLCVCGQKRSSILSLSGVYLMLSFKLNSNTISSSKCTGLVELDQKQHCAKQGTVISLNPQLIWERTAWKCFRYHWNFL